MSATSIFAVSGPTIPPAPQKKPLEFGRWEMLPEFRSAVREVPEEFFQKENSYKENPLGETVYAARASEYSVVISRFGLLSARIMIFRDEDRAFFYELESNFRDWSEVSLVSSLRILDEIEKRCRQIEMPASEIDDLLLKTSLSFIEEVEGQLKERNRQPSPEMVFELIAIRQLRSGILRRSGQLAEARTDLEKAKKILFELVGESDSLENVINKLQSEADYPAISGNYRFRFILSLWLIVHALKDSENYERLNKLLVDNFPK